MADFYRNGGDDDFYNHSEGRVKFNPRQRMRNTSASKFLQNSENLAIQKQAIATIPRMGFMKSDKKDGKIKTFFKKKSALFTILMLMGGGSFMAIGSQSMMLFAVKENFTSMYDNSFTSRSMRMPKLMKWIMNLENDETDVARAHRGIFGSDYIKYRKMSKGKLKKLKAQGIEVVSENGENVLKWTNKAGKKITIKADEYGDFYRTNAEFRGDFNRAGRSFMGRIAAWIDLSSARFFSKYNLTKNLFKDWTNKVYEAEGEDSSFLDIIKNRKKDSLNIESGASSKRQESDEVDADGSRNNKTTSVETGDQKKVVASLKNIVNDTLSVTSSAVCGAAAVSSTLSAIQAATTITNAINYFQALMESTDKTIAGNGTNSPIHEAANNLVEKDENGKIALQAEGMVLALSGGTYSPDQNESNTKNLTMDSLYEDFEILGMNVKLTTSTVIACSIAQVVTAAVSFGISVATFGTFSIGKMFFSSALSFGVGIFTEKALRKIVEQVASKLVDDVCTDTVGLARGACTALGGDLELSGNFRAGGGSLGSKKKVADFYDAHVLALEQEAEYDRMTHDPFDITNQNTFLGSLVRKIALPVAQINSPSGILSEISSLVSSSMTSLLPMASAIDKTQYLENQIGDCPSLEAIGAVGNINCNPIVIDDVETSDYDPEINMNRMANNGAFERNDDESIKIENGVEVIDEKSNLMKYIKYCSERESPFGMIDANILGEESSVTQNSTLRTVVGSVPFLGEVVDGLEGVKQMRALGWATGANCVARDDNAEEISGEGAVGGDENGVGVAIKQWFLKVINWEEMRDYQRYVEDDRLMQSVDEDYNSPVLAALEKYEQENPVDNSLEGTLARKTGYTKEQIAYALNEQAYWQYVAEYDPENLYPTPIVKNSFDFGDFLKNNDILLEKTIADLKLSPQYRFVRRVFVLG